MSYCYKYFRRELGKDNLNKKEAKKKKVTHSY